MNSIKVNLLEKETILKFNKIKFNKIKYLETLQSSKTTTSVAMVIPLTSPLLPQPFQNDPIFLSMERKKEKKLHIMSNENLFSAKRCRYPILLKRNPDFVVSLVKSLFCTKN